MSSSHLDPLPSDYLNLITKSSVSHTTNLANVSTIIARLELAKSQLAGTAPRLPEDGDDPAPSASDTLLPLSSFVKQANQNAAKESKEWGNAVNRFSKSVDKKFPGPPPPLFPPSPSHSAPAPPPTLHPSLLSLSPSGSASRSAAPAEDATPLAPFSSPSEISALNETIALHLARIGAFSSLSTFLSESGTPSSLSDELVSELQKLHSILTNLSKGVCEDAIEWVLEHPERDPKGDLEFALRKEEFIRILLGGEGESTMTDSEMETEPLLSTTPSRSTPDPHIQAALAYGGTHFRHLLTPSRTVLICSLLTSPLFMPLPKLLSSPYGPLFQPYADSSASSTSTSSVTQELCANFSKAYLESLGMAKDSALTVVTDVGGSGAMGKIMKVRNVMKEKRTEWSASGELPVEVPLPISYRYHSIFSCPVSKEQSTATNPPMLLPCGHCIAKESLLRLARGTPTLKCPYCPIVSHVSACVRVHF
ncbi:ubiquitin-protein ligase RMD5 [Sporobolomyces salmoneus]|uniref:ubiquitin-protein ligase RMD5 n=1 Tax=Sporobolomyces salmoneus TaxID=183962 RepID=UPI0031810DB7